MMLEALIKVSFEKNMDAESPKKEYSKNKMNGILSVLFFMKKNMRKTGTNKGFVDCKNKASSLTAPITFKMIKRNRAPVKTLLKLNLNKLFII